MPNGPNGEQRPRDVAQLAHAIVGIATGEIQEGRPAKRRVPARAAGGAKGGPARANTLTSERRSEIARAAAAARWGS